MDTFTLYIVSAVIAAVAVGILIGWLIFSRRQHVTIERPTLDGTPPSPTLRREPVVPFTPLKRNLAEELKNFNPPVSDKIIENPDNLMNIKGIGPRLAKTLYDMGIGHYSTIAAWTPEDIHRIDSVLGPFSGRIEKDQWVEQAKFLAANDLEGFKARFGKLGTDLS